jgi:hypothetical protein
MEHNLDPRPVEIDNTITGEIRAMLEHYKAMHDLKPYTAEVDIEQLNKQIEDNRTTQLFYPLYEVTPSLTGRASLLELARDMVAEKKSDEGMSDLARVLEAVVTSYRFLKKKIIPNSVILEAYNNALEDGEEPIKSQWLGWRLRKLQLRRIRVGDKQGSRAVEVEHRKLYRLARRYAPQIARTLTETSESSEHAQISDNPTVSSPQTLSENLRGKTPVSVNSVNSDNVLDIPPRLGPDILSFTVQSKGEIVEEGIMPSGYGKVSHETIDKYPNIEGPVKCIRCKTPYDNLLARETAYRSGEDPCYRLPNGEASSQ